MLDCTIFDVETDGLLHEVTKIHCLSYSIFCEGELVESGSLTDYNEIREFILSQAVLVGHNIIRYDIPVLEKLLNIRITARLIDTLPISWYLKPQKGFKHGLEAWGERLGFPKPVITDWENLTIEEYIHRCESDVEINTRLFQQQLGHLGLLYDYEQGAINRLLAYLNYKILCAREQEEVGCKIDVPLIERSLSELYVLREEKVEALREAMPLNIKYKQVEKPSKMVKKDGDLSARGIKWHQLLMEHNLPEDYDSTVMVKILEESGNPGSTIQLKDWLFSLGWVPATFEHRKNTKGDVRPVPQIYDGSEVCDSIKALYEVEPALENLNMLSLVKHRIIIFEAFLSERDENDYIQAQVAGLTNTLRFKHRLPVVNLPSIRKFYGEQIRGSIIAPNSEQYLLCGSDMSSLEDTTKQHYMYYFDPEYVMEMRVPGFDPHLDIAILAGMLTAEQVAEHKLYGKTKGAEGVDHSGTRGKAKTVNFAGVYGAGAPKIAQSTGMPLAQAEALHRTYWTRNKAVKQVASSTKIKVVEFAGEKQMWQFNPVSSMWYSLRFKKDRFSTLNQGTGVYCFDLWVREVRKRGIRIMLQYHDEIVFSLERGKEEETERLLLEAIEAVNEVVGLNVPLGVSVDFGDNYAQIH